MSDNSYWLMKSEPSVFSFSDLKASEGKCTCWDGVRNYQARNYMRDDMRLGDLVLFYHSRCKEPGVIGLAYISRESYADHSAFDKSSSYHDPRSTPDNPRWYMVDIAYKADFNNFVSLSTMKACAELSGMVLVRRGSRLSVQVVREDEFRIICAMGGISV